MASISDVPYFVLYEIYRILCISGDKKDAINFAQALPSFWRIRIKDCQKKYEISARKYNYRQLFNVFCQMRDPYFMYLFDTNGKMDKMLYGIGLIDSKMELLCSMVETAALSGQQIIIDYLLKTCEKYFGEEWADILILGKKFIPFVSKNNVSYYLNRVLSEIKDIDWLYIDDVFTYKNATVIRGFLKADVENKGSDYYWVLSKCCTEGHNDIISLIYEYYPDAICPNCRTHCEKRAARS